MRSLRMPGPGALYAPVKVVQERYHGVCALTIRRWGEADWGFPKPIRIGGQRFWSIKELDEFDARQMAARSQPQAEEEAAA